MSYTSTSKRSFAELTQTGLDSNASSTTSSLDISDNEWVAFEAIANTGTHGTHVLTLQCSMDDSNWTDTASTLTGTGVVDKVQIIAKFVRLKVTTVESATSTIDVTIQAK